MHERVRGNYVTAAGEAKSYRAADEDLLLWVHIAFMESFLRAHQMVAWRAIPGGADSYVALWSKSVEPLGLSRVPMTEAELIAEIDRQKANLKTSETTFDVVKFIQYPPLPASARPIYRLLFEAAVLSLEPEFREILGLKAKPRWMIQPLTRTVLKLMRKAIGPESPIEDAAKARLRRIGAWSPVS
jgi:uncharacterized protein (DUF2236 family)